MLTTTTLVSSAMASPTIGDQLADMFAQVGPIAFYFVVWGLVFAGTALFVGVFIPFITGDSLLFAAGIAAATSDDISIWILAMVMLRNQAMAPSSPPSPVTRSVSCSGATSGAPISAAAAVDG